MAITAVSGAIKTEGQAALNAVTRVVADGTTISAGTLLELTDPNTAAANNGVADPWAGIMAIDKLADDGSTTGSAYMEGVFDMWTADGPITAGAAVSSSGANLIRAAVAGDLLTGAHIGWALDSSAAAIGEQIRVRLRGT